MAPKETNDTEAHVCSRVRGIIRLTKSCQIELALASQTPRRPAQADLALRLL